MINRRCKLCGKPFLGKRLAAWRMFYAHVFLSIPAAGLFRCAGHFFSASGGQLRGCPPSEFAHLLLSVLLSVFLSFLLCYCFSLILALFLSLFWVCLSAPPLCFLVDLPYGFIMSFFVFELLAFCPSADFLPCFVLSVCSSLFHSLCLISFLHHLFQANCRSVFLPCVWLSFSPVCISYSVFVFVHHYLLGAKNVGRAPESACTRGKQCGRQYFGEGILVL